MIAAQHKQSISFTNDEVLETLDGRRTQFHRPLRTQPLWVYGGDLVPVKTADADPKGAINCPYRVGEQLLVKETIYFADVHANAYYSADRKGVGDSVYQQLLVIRRGRNVISSIHMPHWASRLTLEITDARVQHLCGNWVWVVTFKVVP